MPAESDIAGHDDAVQAAEIRRFGRGMIGAGLGLLALALALWAIYGSAVFMNVMTTAWSYCF